MPSYLQRLKEQNPRLGEFYSDDEIIEYLPQHDPQEFGSLDPEQVRFKALDDRGPIRKGFSAGIDQMQAMGGGLAAMAGDVTGADSVKDWGLDVYRRNMEEAALSAPETSFMEIDGVGDAMNWAGYTLGNLAPMMATSIAGGGVGGILASQATKATAASMLKSLTAKGVAAEMAKKEVGKFVAKRVALGQALGAASASSGMITGSLYGETEDAAVSTVHGIIAGSIDALPIMRIFGRFGKSQAAKEALESSVIREIGKQGVLEGGTEAVQTFIEQHANHWVETEGKSLLGDLGETDWRQIIEAGAAGALGGGAMGGGASLVSGDPMFFRKPAAQKPEDELDSAIDNADRAANDTLNRGGDALDAEIARAATEEIELPQAVLNARATARRLYSDPVTAPESPLTVPGQMPDFPRTQSPVSDQTIPGQWNQPSATSTLTPSENTPIDSMILAARKTGDETSAARLEAAKRMQALSERFAFEGNEQRAANMAERAQVIIEDVKGKLPVEETQAPEPPAQSGERISVWTGRRGDGYETQEAAEAGLATRKKMRADLDWRIELMPSGKYQLAGYATERQARDRLAQPDMQAVDALAQARTEGESRRADQPDPAVRDMRGAAIDRAMRSIEARKGVATQAEADLLAEYGMGRPYDRVMESPQNAQETRSTKPATDVLASLDRLAEPTGVRTVKMSSGEAFPSEDYARKSLPFRSNPGARIIPSDDGGVLIEISERADQGAQWRKFAPETGTLNVPRETMPQIKAEHRGAMVNFLKGRFISSEKESVAANTLKPTQTEFSPAKVKQALEYEGGNRSILVSSDNYVVDGHHQWLASLDGDIQVIRIDAPIQEILEVIQEFPSATTGEATPDGNYSAQLVSFAKKAKSLKEVRDYAVKQFGPRSLKALDQAITGAWNIRNQEQRKKIKDSDTISVAVAKLGGIKPEWQQDITGDTKANKMVPGVGQVFGKTGTSPDQMALMLLENGYITQAQYDDMDGRDALYDGLNDDLSGRRKVYRVDSLKAQEEQLQELEDQYADEIAQLENQREQKYRDIEQEHGAETAELARLWDIAADQAVDRLIEDAAIYEEQAQEIENVRQSSAEADLNPEDRAASDERVRQTPEEENREPAEAGRGQAQAGASPGIEQAPAPAAASSEAVVVSGDGNSDLKAQFPRTMGFVEWALGRAEPATETVEFDGQKYTKESRIFRGNIGGRGLSIREEIGAQSKFLINDSDHTLEIRIDGNYTRERGKVAVIDIKYTPITEPARFSKSEEKTLYVAHNLSAENLRHADEIGGLAAPSLAIADIEKGVFDSFGEITLLADPSITQSKSARTFNADAYSPRHPRAQIRINEKEYNKLIERLDAATSDIRYLKNPGIADLESNGARELVNNHAFMYAHLKSKGISIKPIRDTKTAPAIRKAAAIIEKLPYSSRREWYNNTNIPELQKIAEDYYRAQDEQYVAATGKSSGIFDEDGELAVHLKQRFISDATSYANSEGIDKTATNAAISKKFRTEKMKNDLEAEAGRVFNSIVKDKVLFKGFTNSGNRRYAAYNMENIVAEMTKSLQGGESYNYGAGSVRSKYASEIKSIQEMRNRKSELVTEEEMKAIKEESQTRLFEAMDALKPYYKYDSNSFGYYDDASSAIAEGRSGLREAFKMNAEVDRIASGITSYLKNLPTQYFETKMQRAVGLDEFATAIVPRGTSEDVIQILQKNGIAIRYYKRGDGQSRLKAIKASKEVLFDQGGIEKSLTAKGNRPGTTAATVTRSIAKSVEKLQAELDVTVVQSIDELPRNLRVQIPANTRIKGAYWNNSVYLVADNIESMRDAQVVLAHELVGHKGVLEMLEPQQWDDLKSKIDRFLGMENRTVRSIAEEVDRRYGNTRDDSWHAEFMAVAAERREKDGPIASLMRTLREYILRALKAFGLNGPFSVSELDIMLSDAERYLSGRRETQGVRAGAMASQQGFDLDQYTEQDIADQARARTDREKAEALRKQRQQADDQVDDFVLTGSNSEADQAAARGQGSLFSSNQSNVNARIEALRNEVKRLMPLVDRAYEKRDLRAAETLDTELESALTELENILSAREEDGIAADADAISETKMIGSNLEEGAASMEDIIGTAYEETYLGSGYQSLSDDAEKIQRLRSAISESAEMNGLSYQEVRGAVDAMTDEQVLELAKDAYENSGRRRAAKRPAKQQIGRSVEQFLSGARFSQSEGGSAFGSTKVNGIWYEEDGERDTVAHVTDRVAEQINAVDYMIKDESQNAAYHANRILPDILYAKKNGIRVSDLAVKRIQKAAAQYRPPVERAPYVPADQQTPEQNQIAFNENEIPYLKNEIRLFERDADRDSLTDQRYLKALKTDLAYREKQQALLRDGVSLDEIQKRIGLLPKNDPSSIKPRQSYFSAEPDTAVIDASREFTEKRLANKTSQRYAKAMFIFNWDIADRLPAGDPGRPSLQDAWLNYIQDEAVAAEAGRNDETFSELRDRYLQELQADIDGQGESGLSALDVVKYVGTFDGGFKRFIEQAGDMPSELAFQAKKVLREMEGGSALFSQSPVTDTKEFRDWFGDSKVVDENGDPLVVYHQTSKDSEQKILESGFTTAYPLARRNDEQVPDGIFFKPTTDDIKVGSHVKDEITQIPVYLSIKKPFVVRARENIEKALGDERYSELARQARELDRQLSAEFDEQWDRLSEKRASTGVRKISDEEWDSFSDDWQSRVDTQIPAASAAARDRLTAVLAERGFDGMIIEEDRGSWGRSTKTFIALRSEQAKSATSNRGTFDPKNPNILFSRDDNNAPNLSRRRFIIGLAGSLAAAKYAGVRQSEVSLGKAIPIASEVARSQISDAAKEILESADGNNDSAILKQAIQEIAQNGPVEFRALAENILELLPDSPITITVNKTHRSNASGSVSLTESPEMKLYVGGDQQGFSHATVLHEALHVSVLARFKTISSAASDRNFKLIDMSAPQAKAAIDQFVSLWQEFKQVVKDSRDEQVSYSEAYSNPDEFFVRALTDPILQKYLAGIKYEGKTLFERFKDWVKSIMFGMGEKGVEASWLDAALLASDDVINAMKNDPANFEIVKRFNAFDKGERFGADSSNALFSKNDSTGFAIPDETLVSVAVRKMQDKFRVLKDLQANIIKAGGDIDENNNAYLAEELFHGKAENDIRQMQEQYVEPLAKKMAEFDITRDQLDQFLYARHARERNARIAQINPEMPDGGSGMTNAQARAKLDEVRATGKQGQYEQLAGIVYDMLQLQRDMVREGGLESDPTIDAWEEGYEFYVPLKGWAEDTKQEGMPRTGKGFAISGRESKRALGRSSQAASPTSFAINDLTEKLVRRRKNEVGNAFLKLVQANPNPDYWQVFTDEKPETQRAVKKVKDPNTGEMVEQVTETAIPMAMLTDRYFTTKKNGKTFYIKLEDPRLMKAMKNIGPESNGALIRTMAGITRVLSALNTSYSPEFMVSNFARDVQTALLNMQAEQSLPGGKAAGVKIAKKTVKDIPKAMKAIYGALRGTEGKTAEAKKWQALFEQFRNDGAKTGWFDMKDLDGQSKSLDNLVAMAEGGFKGKAMLWTREAAKLVENMNQSVENAVRLAAYANALDAGISRKQAASLAKNMTVNFNRRGEIGTVLNAIYMFANASIQGTANFVRTMGALKGDGGPTWSNLNNAQKIAVGMMAGAYFIGLANRMSAGEDEDDENWYDKVPDYVKERNIVIMKSLFGGAQDGSFWKIPLPYGYNVFYVLGNAIEAVTGGGKSVSQSAGDVTLAALGSFSPIGFQHSDSGANMVLKNAAPTIIKPIVEVALNENFMGSSIYTENLPFGTPRPDSALGRNSTPEAYRALSRWLNEVTGGSEYRPGAVDINPDVMQHFLDFFGGSAYAFFGSKVPDAVHRAAAGVVAEENRVPFLSRISGKVLPYADTEKFYQRRDVINQVYDEYRAIPAAERSSFDKAQLLKMRPLLKATERRLSALRKVRDRIYSADLSLRERDPQLKEVETDMKSAIDRFNKAYSAIDR